MNKSHLTVYIISYTAPHGRLDGSAHICCLVRRLPYGDPVDGDVFC